MNTTVVTQEQLSAFVDGELEDPYIDAALASLRQNELKNEWSLYHQIGDVLRSDDMAQDVSPDFMTRLSKRLESEPVIVAPGALAQTPSQTSPSAAPGKLLSTGQSPRRRTLSGLAAATAVAALAYFSVPPLMVALKSNSDSAVVAASSSSGTSTSGASLAGEAIPVKANAVAANAPAGTVLRDARIDDYLFAHQRYSPSVYSTAQYARPATHPTESNR